MTKIKYNCYEMTKTKYNCYEFYSLLNKQNFSVDTAKLSATLYLLQGNHWYKVNYSLPTNMQGIKVVNVDKKRVKKWQSLQKR